MLIIVRVLLLCSFKAWNCVFVFKSKWLILTLGLPALQSEKATPHVSEINSNGKKATENQSIKPGFQYLSTLIFFYTCECLFRKVWGGGWQMAAPYNRLPMKSDATCLFIWMLRNWGISAFGRHGNHYQTPASYITDNKINITTDTCSAELIRPILIVLIFLIDNTIDTNSNHVHINFLFKISVRKIY